MLNPSFNQLMRAMLDACPNAIIQESPEGEVTVYTGYIVCASDNDAPLADFDREETE